MVPVITHFKLNPIPSQPKIVVIFRKQNQNLNCFSSACLTPSWIFFTTIAKCLYDQTPCLHNRLHKLHLLCDNKMLSANQMSQTRNTADKVWWPPAPVVVPDHCLGWKTNEAKNDTRRLNQCLSQRLNNGWCLSSPISN